MLVLSVHECVVATESLSRFKAFLIVPVTVTAVISLRGTMTGMIGVAFIGARKEA